MAVPFRTGPDRDLWRPLPGDEPQQHRPLGVVRVGVEQGDRLPGAEREPAVHHGHA